MSSSTTTDQALLAAADDAPEAFGTLYDRHAPALGRWLAARCDREAALELLGETFAQAWIHRGRYRAAKGSVSGWLWGIARNLLHDYYRRHRVANAARKRLALDVVPTGDHADEVEERLDAAALSDELASSLAELPQPTREAVLLRVVGGLEYDAIASELRCSPVHARARVSRGLRALKNSIALSMPNYEAPR